MKRIIFFNHFHRGDLFTHKEFIRQVKEALPNIDYHYWHFNHPKVNLDLGIQHTSFPDKLDQNIHFLKDETQGTLLINTWIGCYKEAMSKHQGINLYSLCEQWESIFAKINEEFGTELKLKPFEEYLPTIDFSFFNVNAVDEFLAKNTKKLILFCNGIPMSGQSFPSDLSEEIKQFAQNNKHINFICTKKFETGIDNILFTDDITKDTEAFPYFKPFWCDREINNCDLNEISYLSTKCDAIIGKNSGPYVFCETRQNLMDEKKIMVSFCTAPNESLSNGVNKKCTYKLVTDFSAESINNTIQEVVRAL